MVVSASPVARRDEAGPGCPKALVALGPVPAATRLRRVLTGTLALCRPCRSLARWRLAPSRPPTVPVRRPRGPRPPATIRELRGVKCTVEDDAEGARRCKALQGARSRARAARGVLECVSGIRGRARNTEHPASRVADGRYSYGPTLGPARQPAWRRYSLQGLLRLPGLQWQRHTPPHVCFLAFYASSCL